MKSIDKGQTEALYIGINSGLSNTKNSIVYADIIGESLRRKAKDLNVPLVTYAEDTATGPGFHLLMYGDKVLANRNSFLGNIGYKVNPWQLKEFKEHWKF